MRIVIDEDGNNLIELMEPKICECERKNTNLYKGKAKLMNTHEELTSRMKTAENQQEIESLVHRTYYKCPRKVSNKYGSNELKGQDLEVQLDKQLGFLYYRVFAKLVQITSYEDQKN